MARISARDDDELYKATRPERHGARARTDSDATLAPLRRSHMGAADVIALQRLAGNAAVQRWLARPTVQRGEGLPAPLPVGDEAEEQATDALAQDRMTLSRAEGPDTGSVRPADRKRLAADDGRSLDAETRAAFEPRYGNLSGVQVHDTESDQLVAWSYGARALSYGGDIWLGPGQSERDHNLIGHELAHVRHSDPGVVHLRRATWLERRAWLGFFDHYLARAFLNQYMDDTNGTRTLTRQEMIDCNPIVDLRRSPAFMTEVGRLRAAGGGTSTISVSGWGGALTNGTLGNFTIYYEGALHVNATGEWDFNGTLRFHDYWDFDAKPFGSGSGRPIPAEIKVRVANALLPGRPFTIESEVVPVSQTSADSRANFPASAPVRVLDRAGGQAADIAAGEIGTPPGGGAAGAEVGAQAGEDATRPRR